MKHISRTNRVFSNMAKEQGQKGMEKYGKSLDPLDDYDWLDMALQEQVDGTQYLVAEQVKRSFILDEIRALASKVGESDENYIDIAQDILHWCNELDGSNRP